MPHYSYKAKKGPTEIVEGEIDADNEDDALSKISALGLIPIKLAESNGQAPKATQSRPEKSEHKPEKKEKKKVNKKETSVDFAPQKNLKVKNKDFNIFTRQFAILLKANVPLLRIFTVLQNQTSDVKFKAVLGDIQEGIRRGSSLSDALKEYPRIFSQLFVSMIEAGEISGSLDVVLMRLSEFAEKEAEVRNRIQSAMIYPFFLMGMGVLTIFALLTFILPRLMDVFSDLGTELPAITKAVIQVSEFCQSYWLIMVGVVVLLSMFLKFKGLSEKQMKSIDALILKLPVFGELIKKSETARFLRSLELLYENGISLFKAVEVATRIVSNRVIKASLYGLPEKLQAGATLTQSLEEVPYISSFVTNMVSVGEESGKLGDAVEETASFYEQEATQVVKVATTLIEPFMILTVGGVIGFIVIAMLLPIFEISAVAQ